MKYFFVIIILLFGCTNNWNPQPDQHTLLGIGIISNDYQVDLNKIDDIYLDMLACTGLTDKYTNDLVIEILSDSDSFKCLNSDNECEGQYDTNRTEPHIIYATSQLNGLAHELGHYFAHIEFDKKAAKLHNKNSWAILCGDPIDSGLWKPETENKDACEDMVSYNINHEEMGSYLGYNVLVQYEQKTYTGAYTVTDIAKVVSWVVETYEDKGYQKPEKLKDRLRYIQVIVTSTDETFGRLYGENIENNNNGSELGAFVFSAGPPSCYDNIDPEANILIVIRQKWMALDRMDHMIHEVMHPTASVLRNGNPDNNHTDSRLWMRQDKTNSIMAIVYDKWMDFLRL